MQELPMDPEVIRKMLNELYPHLERLETQTTALLQFLTAKGIVKDDELAPFVEEAGKASYVKWLTTRLRIEHVISSAAKEAVKPAEIKLPAPPSEPKEQKSIEPPPRAAQEAPPRDESDRSAEERSKVTAPQKEQGAA
jgi:hypothetical protein